MQKRGMRRSDIAFVPSESDSSLLLFFFLNFICLCLAALSLHCYARPFSSCGEPRLLPNCGARAPQCHGISGYRAWTLEDGGFSSCGSQALELGIKSCGTQD